MINEIIDHLNDPEVKTPFDQIKIITDDMVKETLAPEIIEADQEDLLKLLVLGSTLMMYMEEHMAKSQERVQKLEDMIIETMGD